MPNVDSPEITERSVGVRVQEALRMTKRYVTSYYGGYVQERGLFQHVNTYCMFIGHARSGGSITGALLDAHPNVVLADEVDALRYVAAGFSREQIYHLILKRASRQAKKGRTKGGRNGKVYSYWVPGQWQGRFKQIKVIGDSKAGFSTQRLAHDPTLLRRLQSLMGPINVKILQIIRNPYDTISTMNIRAGRAIENGIQRYFANCETIAGVRDQIGPSNILSIKHEELIAAPQEQLGRMCRFLGVEPLPDYLDACAGILYESPAKSRHKVAWSPELIARVEHDIARFDFLAGYSYDA